MATDSGFKIEGAGDGQAPEMAPVQGRYRVTGPSKLGDQRLEVIARFIGVDPLTVCNDLRTAIREAATHNRWTENRRALLAYFAGALHCARFDPDEPMKIGDIAAFRDARDGDPPLFRLRGPDATELLLRAQVPEQWLIDADTIRFGMIRKPDQAGDNGDQAGDNGDEHKAQGPSPGTELLLGASQWGAALGVDRFKSQYALAAELKGLVAPEQAGELAELGNLFESVIARKFRERYQDEYRITQPSSSLVDDFRRATPDLVLCADYEAAPHEIELWQIKCDFERPPKYEPPPLTGRKAVPETVWAQLHGEACVIEQFTQSNSERYRVKRLGVAVFCFGGSPVYREYAFEVDRDYLAEAAAATRDFWFRYVKGDAMPPPDASRATKRAQDIQFSAGFREDEPRPLPDTVRPKVEAAAERLRQYYQARRQIKDALGRLTAWFREILGDYHFVETDQGRIQWSRPIAGGRVVDKDALFAELATTIDPDILARHTREASPYRRFCPPRDWSKSDDKS